MHAIIIFIQLVHMLELWYMICVYVLLCHYTCVYDVHVDA